MAAMALAVARHGLLETRVEDVISYATASRRTFYDHFANRTQCFLATYDAVRDDVLRSIAQNSPSLEGALGAVLEHFASWPSHAHVFLCDVYAVGPEGVRRHHETLSSIAASLRRCGGVDRRAPRPLTQHQRLHGAVGAVQHLILRSLAEDGAAALPKLAPALAALLRQAPRRGS